MNFSFGTIMAIPSLVMNDRASRANLLYLTGDASDFNAVSDGDRSFGENEQTADEITRDVFQTEPHAYTNCAGEYRQRTKVDAGIVENDDDPDDQHDVADDLRNGVLERTIQSTLSEESIKEKALRSRRNPEHGNQQSDKQKNLKET